MSSNDSFGPPIKDLHIPRRLPYHRHKSRSWRDAFGHLVNPEDFDEDFDDVNAQEDVSDEKPVENPVGSPEQDIDDECPPRSFTF